MNAVALNPDMGWMPRPADVEAPGLARTAASARGDTVTVPERRWP
jgi:hypothetical protein